MLTYRKARPDEFDAMVAFSNMVFNHKGDPIQFDRDLTKVYGKDADRQFVAAMHTLAVDDDKGIRALFGALPNVMHTPAGDLNTRYIGTVSVHPDARGEGHMKAILSSILREAKEDGVDFALLGGQRQRYAYFGFAPSGEVWSETVIDANVRHAMKDVDASGVVWTRVERDDLDSAKDAAALYERSLIRFERPVERFTELCESYGQSLYLARRQGEAIGYAVVNRGLNRWAEVVASDVNALDAMIKRWMYFYGRASLEMLFPDWQAKERLHVATYAEDVSMTSGACANVLNPRRVIETLLNAKARYAYVEDGTMAFAIDGDEPFRVTVNGGVARIEPCDYAEATRLTALEATSLLSCPYPYEGRPDAPNTWFPLPLFAQEPDSF